MASKDKEWSRRKHLKSPTYYLPQPILSTTRMVTPIQLGRFTRHHNKASLESIFSCTMANKKFDAMLN